VIVLIGVLKSKKTGKPVTNKGYIYGDIYLSLGKQNAPMTVKYNFLNNFYKG